MVFNFMEEVKRELPKFSTGANRIYHINKIIENRENWFKIAREHLQKLVEYMRKIDSSDLDLGSASSKNKIWFRIYSIKKPCHEFPQYDDDEIAIMLLSILSEDNKKKLFDKKNIDFSLSLSLGEDKYKIRFRGDIYFETNLLVGNFRRINDEIFNIETLGFPEKIIKRLDLEYEKSGLILVTGITGSGKSCTLDSIVDMNNSKNDAHIVIIGNPIEYLHKSKKCLIRHREIGEDVKSFRDGTIQSLRQDPDIIIVGEMRDPQTISTVLEVTDSGHKVFTTLHTNSAVDSMHRIIAEFPPNEQDRIRLRLADTLKVCISQKLIPNRKNKLTLAKEILSVDNSIQAAIRNKNINEIYQMVTEGKNKGMFTLEQNLSYLYKQNIITKNTAMNYANNRKRMYQLITF